MEVIYLYNEELDTLQELTEVTNSKLIEIASEVSKELTERVNEAWDKLPNFRGDSTTKCEEVDELFAQNNSEIEPVAESATTIDEVVDFNNMISAGGRIRNLPPIELKRPKREWIFNPKDAIDSMFAKPKCPECGFESADGGNFCSNCGSDMRGGTENESK